MLRILCNIFIAVMVVGAVLAHGRKSPLPKVLRYFTAQSNVLYAFACLCTAIMFLGGYSWYPVLVFKFVGTVALMVTMLTVFIFLGPQFGYKVLLTGPDLWLHLVCPVLALASWFGWERCSIPPATALLGVLPVLLYGTLYLRKVVFLGAWEDFYGFNRGGRWRVSFLVMGLTTTLLSLGLAALS